MIKKISRNKAVKRFRLIGIGHNAKNTTMPPNGRVHGSLVRRGEYLLSETTTTTTITTTTTV
jgi:hypothetical protein